MIRSLTAAMALLLTLAQPTLADGPRTIVVMDGSGSMWGQIDGRAKLEIARETVAEVLGTLPPDQELGLMAYGHRRRGDCTDIELVVRPAPGTAPAILDTVNSMRFLGKTPLSEAVKQAADALRYAEDAATVVLVTDGLETCNADPCALGRELEATGLNFTAHVIGFGLTQEEGAQVACLATETGGRYIQASDAGTLATALRETIVATAPEPDPVPEPAPATLPDATLDAPAQAAKGSEITISWTGPDGPLDAIEIATPGQGAGRFYVYTRQGNPVTLRMPAQIGTYELRYKFGDRDVLATRSIDIVEALVTLDAPDVVGAGTDVSILWQGPDAPLDNIQIAKAGTDSYETYGYVSGSNPVILTAPEEPGDYEILYKFGDSEIIARRPLTIVPAGQVPLDQGSAPADPATFETEAMGEDAPTDAPGDPVPVSISGIYGFAVNWLAIPMSGQDSLVLGDVSPQGGAWDTRLDPGTWRIIGRADGAIGAVYAGDIQITPTTDPAIVMPHFTDYPTRTDDGGYRCTGKPLCSLGDDATGLGMMLQDGSATDAPLFMETAAGVRAATPMVSLLDISGATEEVIAVLNPLQWLESNGTCTDTPAGPFCIFAGITPAQADAARVIAASVYLGAPRDTPDTLKTNGIAVPDAPADLFDLLAPDWKRN